MRKISYGINSYHKTASIVVEYANPFVFFLESVTAIICSRIPHIPLPNFTIVRDGETTTIKEYYGDLNSLFHLKICCPMFEFSGRHTEMRIIEVDYNKAREVFYEKDKKFWDECEERGKEYGNRRTED